MVLDSEQGHVGRRCLISSGTSSISHMACYATGGVDTPASFVGFLNYRVREPLCASALIGTRPVSDEVFGRHCPTHKAPPGAQGRDRRRLPRCSTSSGTALYCSNEVAKGGDSYCNFFDITASVRSHILRWSWKIGQLVKVYSTG